MSSVQQNFDILNRKVRGVSHYACGKHSQQFYQGIVYIPFLSTIVNLLIVVLWVLGFIGAIQGEKKKVPVLGDQFQEWFKGIG